MSQRIDPGAAAAAHSSATAAHDVRRRQRRDRDLAGRRHLGDRARGRALDAPRPGPRRGRSRSPRARRRRGWRRSPRRCSPVRRPRRETVSAPRSSRTLSRMIALVSAASKVGMSFTNIVGSGSPSVCGKSDPKSSRSMPTASLSRRHVVLVVRRHPDLLGELLHGVALEGERHLAVGVLQVAEEVGHPHGAVLDRGQLQRRGTARARRGRSGRRTCRRCRGRRTRPSGTPGAGRP